MINAIIHNAYSRDVPPKFELFADRLEITSAGGLPQGFSQAEFFMGYSVPQNKELMRVFRDVELVEQLGSGVPRILQAYSKTAFCFIIMWRVVWRHRVGGWPRLRGGRRTWGKPLHHKPSAGLFHRPLSISKPSSTTLLGAYAKQDTYANTRKNASEVPRVVLSTTSLAGQGASAQHGGHDTL